MVSYEIPEGEWPVFFDRFAREHAGWSTTIDLHESGKIAERTADALPLCDISIAAGGREKVEILIRAGIAGEITQRVHQPRTVRMAASGYWPDAAVQIETEKGPTALVHVWSNANESRQTG